MFACIIQTRKTFPPALVLLHCAKSTKSIYQTVTMSQHGQTAMLTTPPTFLSPQSKEKLCAREERGKKGGEFKWVCAHKMKTERIRESCGEVCALCG